MQTCNNKILDKLLNSIVTELKRNDDIVKPNRIPFTVAALWQCFRAESETFKELISDLESYPDYGIIVENSQNDYNGICDIKIILCEYIDCGEDYGMYDYNYADYHYVINIEDDERMWGYCECTPDMEDYREDKKCCGHGCDWDAPSFKLHKVYEVVKHSWSGDEHAYWEFEDKFYMSESELNEQNEREMREYEIKRLKETVEDAQKRLRELGVD